MGTENSKGTKVFSLTGKVNNTGLVEVPMGMTLRELVYDVGGGVPDGKEVQGRADRRSFRRVSSRRACSTSRSTSTSSRKAGSIMGSGGMIVMDEDTCMVDVARFFVRLPRATSRAASASRAARVCVRW